MDEPDAPVQLTKFCGVVHEIENLERYYYAEVQAGGSRSSDNHSAVHFGTRSVARPAVIDSGSMDLALYHSNGIGTRWVPPSSVHVDDNDYHSSVLGKDSYL
jgi:hypothetical protein